MFPKKVTEEGQWPENMATVKEALLKWACASSSFLYISAPDLHLLMLAADMYKKIYAIVEKNVLHNW